jgi:hypothetical protein
MTETPTQMSAEIPTHPGDVLMALIIALLAPLFLTTAGGDIAFARMAAIETVSAYRARSLMDLMAIAQIIACGLTALGSLSLSLGDDLSLSMILRLRGNAVALNRVAEQNRRTLTAAQGFGPKSVEPHAPPDPASDPAYEAKVMADLATAKALTAEAMTTLQTPEPAPQPILVVASPAAQPPFIQPVIAPPVIAAPESPLPAAPRGSLREWHVILANAMTEVAGQFTTNFDQLTPKERDLANYKAALLSSAATDVLLGNVPPMLKPGDLDAIRGPNRA